MQLVPSSVLMFSSKKNSFLSETNFPECWVIYFDVETSKSHIIGWLPRSSCMISADALETSCKL